MLSAQIRPIFFSFAIATMLIFSSSADAIYSPAHLRSLHHSLSPYSISQHLAFYELYPNSREGKCALERAWQLLGAKETVGPVPAYIASSSLDTLHAILKLVNRPLFAEKIMLPEGQLQLIEMLGSNLPNRTLKGHTATSEEEILHLKDYEIDIARGMLLAQLSDSPDKMSLIRQYEALLDLMALQILAELKPMGGLRASHMQKIDKINYFIFNELRFRFPPHSTYAPQVDVYTFLPSVLDSRRGVCLGVSLLYLALAERLSLPLEIITPPGHIYLRYFDGSSCINIETTARGVHLPSDTYLGINTKALQKRNRKETIGLAHFNQAAVFSQLEEYDKAISAYEKASRYLPNYLLLHELLAYHYLFEGRIEDGRRLLLSINGLTPPDKVVADSTADDYLSGKVDEEGIKAIFLQVDETQDSIRCKQEKLEKTLAEYPFFRSGIIQLATTWLQLKKDKEALSLLKKYHELDPGDPTVEYYLTVLYAERLDYNAAWKHLKEAERILQSACHEPKALKELRQALQKLSPE